MELPFEDKSFDHVYVIEAVCHAPEKVHQQYLLCSSKRILDYFRLDVLRKFFVSLNPVEHLLVMTGVLLRNMMIEILNM